MDRRTFLAALAGLVVGPACALRLTASATQQPHLASISGYVFDRNRRRDLRLPFKPVFLHKIGEKASVHPFGEARTDAHGRYHFSNVECGLYYIQADGCKFYPFYVLEPVEYWVNIFAHPLVRV